MTYKQLALFLLAAISAWSQQVIATGLADPQKFVLTSGGNFLVTETSTTINSGRVSFVSRSGTRRTLLDKLPSGTAAPGDGSGPTGLALKGQTLYLAIGAGDAERNGTQAGTSQYNPQGASSPIFSSVLVLRFSADVDSITGAFTFTPQIQQRIADGFEVSLDNGAGSTAQVSLLAAFPYAVPDPNTIYRFSNLWGIELSEDGRTLYMVDASQNTVNVVDTTTGRWRRIARFAPIPNRSGVGPPVSDSVPTSIRVYGDQLLVSFLTGFPFVRGAAQVMSVQPDTGVSAAFIANLSSATDVLWRSRTGDRPQFFVIEHSQNMLAQPRAPGRLLRYDSPQATVMSDALLGPVSMAFDATSNSLFVLELSGRIVEFRL